MRGSWLLGTTFFAPLLLLHGCTGREEPAAWKAQSSPAETVAFDPSTGTAGIAGVAVLDGPAPAQSELRMHADPVCVAHQRGSVFTEDVIVSNGRLANVFVHIKEGLQRYSFAPPSEPATLVQEGCRYNPHVSGVVVNQKLRIVNNDPTMHNVHCWAEVNGRFNIGQPVQGMEVVRAFARPEIMIRFSCDVHKWMTCYVGVVAHPFFAVTGRDGAFSLKGLPPGEYVIEAWHEKYGAKREPVKLADGQIGSVRFAFTAS